MLIRFPVCELGSTKHQHGDLAMSLLSFAPILSDTWIEVERWLLILVVQDGQGYNAQMSMAEHLLALFCVWSAKNVSYRVFTSLACCLDFSLPTLRRLLS